LEVNKDTFFDN